MDIEDLKAELDAILNPEPDEDGKHPTRDIPHPRLENKHKLDLSYLRTFDWEGSSGHPCTRLCPSDEKRLPSLIRNLDVPSRLFEAGFGLFSDSIIAYHLKKERKGNLHYYPPAILTFWAGFETFVRLSSELLLITVYNVPPEITHYLREEELFVDKKGNINIRKRYQSVLDRYSVLLRYGYDYQINRGLRYWQQLERAGDLRDYYTHLDVNEPRAISSEQVVQFMESVMLGIIWPSSEMKCTQLLGIYNLYWIWDSLRKLAEPFIEQPLLKDWSFFNSCTLYLPFKNVDTLRFPNRQDEIRLQK